MINPKSHLERKIFFDGSPGIARYENLKYPWIEKLVTKQLSFFWIPEEVNLTQDARDWKSMSDHEKFIFTSNLKRQILLDSVQGRSPSIAFLPIVSLPEMENWIQTWAFSETIHSRSYTHIIRNVYANPSEVFDTIMQIEEIVKCSNDISRYYDDLIMNVDKKALWLCLMSVNILEGIRFYASFACSWAFAENKKMEGNAKIIKLICRDENLHLAGTQQLLKTLLKDDSDFIEIANDNKDACIKMFVDAVEQEKAWAKYIFTGGSIIGLNEELLVNYVEFIANKRMTALGLESPYKTTQNPLPWTQKWIAGSEVQVAPQEVELSSYVIGGVVNDVNNDSFKGMKI